MMGMSVRQLGTGRHDAAGLADALRTIVRGARAEHRRAARQPDHPELP